MLLILRDFLKLGQQNVCDSDTKFRKKYHLIVICNHDFDYFREVIDYDCDYIVFSMNVIDYEFAIVIVIVPTIVITDYDYPMPGIYTVQTTTQLVLSMDTVRLLYTRHSGYL